MWTNNPTAYCCDLFKSSIDASGMAGISIAPVLVKASGRRYFRVEFNAVAKAECFAFDKLPCTEVKLVLSTSQAIRYCPFCGVKLEWHYRISFSSLDNIVYEE